MLCPCENYWDDEFSRVTELDWFLTKFDATGGRLLLLATMRWFYTLTKPFSGVKGSVARAATEELQLLVAIFLLLLYSLYALF